MREVTGYFFFMSNLNSQKREIGTYCMQYDGEMPGYFGVEGNFQT